MQGSTKVVLGYPDSYVVPTMLSYAGYDSENDESPEIDWSQAEYNALADMRAETILTSPYYSYGGGRNYEVAMHFYDDYGSRSCLLRLGWRIQCHIVDEWKTDGQSFKLECRGVRARYYNTGAPLYQNVGEWNDFGRLYFQYSEDAALFTLGANMLDNFGTDDLHIDMVHLNNAQRAGSYQPWSAWWYNDAPLYVDLDPDYIHNMVGNELYLWVMAPFWYEPFWHPADNATIKWQFYTPKLHAYL